MSVRKFSTASILSPAYKNSKIWDGETFPGYFESIATVVVPSGGQASVTFSNIPNTYKHLQIRMITRSSRSAVSDNTKLQFNGDTASNYRSHYIYTNGGDVSSGDYGNLGWIYANFDAGNTAASSVYSSSIIDILDYTSTTKNKTVRTLTGYDENGAGYISFLSGVWFNASSSITSLTLFPTTGPNYLQNSHFALYGIRGA